MLPIAPDTLLQQRYRILNILAEGGLGRTYVAIDRDRNDAYCAIEELIPSSQLASAVAGAKEFFKQEVTLLYQLQHPQIPRFWTTFEEQNRLFLVRDYISGETYGNLSERRPQGTAFSEAEVRQLLRQILPVIGYIHSKGIVHGDLSPEHIIHRDSDGLPVLIDFGVIREFANKLQATPAHQQMSPGQLGYAPAEQLHSKQAYPNSDLYALAVVAIVLMTGKEPSALFEGNLMNWSWRKWTQIDDGFAQILSQMLSPEPYDRYQSAIEVERDLRSLDSPHLQPPDELNSSRPSTIPTVVVGGKSIPVTNRETAIINRSAKSIWEKPQVFIPLAVLISLLAGVGSWFGVTQLLHRQSSDPVATTPPKQADFNNPTIPTDSSSPSPTASDLIQPEMDRAILKEGTVNADTPIRYRIAALAGQNLDIELVPAIDPTKLSSPISPIAPSPGTKDPQFVNPPISVPTPATTQVLMTILSPTGTPIDNKSDRVVNWRGQVQTSGDYTVELRPIKGLAGSEFAYKLSITQLAVMPTPSPVTSPSSVDALPSPGVPVPIGGNGINGSPANLNPDRIDRNIPGISPSSLPIEVPTTRPTPTPTESERPTRRRRRNRTQIEPSPQVRERNRVESTDESTPPPRRRRNRVDSTDESTPTPRRRRNGDSETRQNPPSNPDVGDNTPSETPKPEPSIGIPVPAPQNNTSPARDGNNTAPPPGSGANYPD